MDKWKRLSIPPICDRMIGFSIPINGTILVVSYEGTHLVHLKEEVTIETDHQFAEYDIYDPNSGVATYQGGEYQIIGLHGGSPILKSPLCECLELNTKDESLTLLHNNKPIFSTPYQNYSGDWVAATFSPDGHYIILGCPYGFDFMVHERVLKTQ